MKLQLSWLNDFVKVDDITPQELADKLVGIGFEVEEIIYTGAEIDKVVTAKILDIKPHADADKLSVCMVDSGNEILTIVTGAKNISVGDMVPLALDGSTLPGGKKIVSSPLRGVMSYGMLCSGKELGVDESTVKGASANGILILDKNVAPGLDIREVLGLNEYIFDISLTANRPDCQSVYGMAREVGALLSRKVKAPSLKYKTVANNESVSVKISAPDLCSRYSARLIGNIKVQESPLWMRRRLKNSGLNPINNIVDITNYVLLEIGQPLHAFDTAFIDGGINVRTAKPGETITALDGNLYELKENMLVIADDKKPLAIAGVMGGEYSGINDNTKTVLLEAARFARGTVRSTSRALGLRSDSSARYEKGVDYMSIDLGRERALSLISQLKAGDIYSFVGYDGIKEPKEKVIKTSAEAICGILGIKIKASDIIKILKSLEITVEDNGSALICHIPRFREDIDNYTDLAEEVIRFYGYDHIVPTLFKLSETTFGGLNNEQKKIERYKSYLVGKGMNEIISYSFINPDFYDKLLFDKNDGVRNAIRIMNPLSEEYSVMRTQLTGSMLDVVRLNCSRKNENFRLFEIAKTYIPNTDEPNELPFENQTLSVAFVGKDEDFYDIKSVLCNMPDLANIDYKLGYSEKRFLHPGISADIIIDGNIIGSFGKVHPTVAKNFDIPENVYVGELNLEYIIDKKRSTVKYDPLPKYPGVARDIAVTVKADYLVGDMFDSVKCAAGELFESIELFDVYTGEQIEKGFKSVAFSVKLRNKEKTLTETEITDTMKAIIEVLEKDFGAKLRS